MADQVPVRADVVPDWHPDTMQPVETNEAAAALVAPAREALAKLYETAAALSDAAAAVRSDPTTTEGAGVLRIEALREKALAKASDALDTGQKRLRARLEEADAEIASALAPDYEARRGSLATEIRSAVKSQPSPFEFVRAAIAAGDRATVAAALAGPAFLTGLTSEAQAILRSEAARAFAPEAAAARASCAKALDVLGRVSSSVFAKWVLEPERRAGDVARIRTRAQAAKNAAAKLD